MGPDSRESERGSGSAAGGGVSRDEDMDPSRGGVSIVMNSEGTGSLAWTSLRADQVGIYSFIPSENREVEFCEHCRGDQDDGAGGDGAGDDDDFNSPALAISNRIPPPPSSTTTLPVGTLHAQNSKDPFPFPILTSFPLTHTGTAGNTRRYT